MFKIFIASKNPGKIHEIQSLLKNLEVSIITPLQAGIDLDIKESGINYAQNAAMKAQAYAEATRLTTLADDSGLEVDALEGAPGLYSARFAPWPEATDADRRKYLLEQLKPHPPPWPARFRCTVALVTPDGEIHFSEGICPGVISAEERGQNGFGYDPIFWIPQLERTMAELTTEEKNHLSHRARAIQAIRPILLTILQGGKENP
jgi:XTP/dITP diphosphohydrolase